MNQEYGGKRQLKGCPEIETRPMALHSLISSQAVAIAESLPAVLEDFLAFRAENGELSDADSISQYLAGAMKSVRKPSFRRRKGQRARGNRPKQAPSPWLNFLGATREETKEVLLNFSENEEMIRELFYGSEHVASENPEEFMQEAYDKLVGKLPAEDLEDRKLDVACISIYAGRCWKHMTQEEQAQYKSAPAAPVEEPAPVEEAAPAKKPAASKRKAAGRKSRKASA